MTAQPAPSRRGLAAAIIAAVALVVLAAAGLWYLFLRPSGPAPVSLGGAAVMAVLTGPWFAYKAIEHGSPLAYSQPNPEQWRQRGRPLAFWASRRPLLSASRRTTTTR